MVALEEVSTTQVAWSGEFGHRNASVIGSSKVGVGSSSTQYEVISSPPFVIGAE